MRDWVKYLQVFQNNTHDCCIKSILIMYKFIWKPNCVFLLVFFFSFNSFFSFSIHVTFATSTYIIYIIWLRLIDTRHTLTIQWRFRRCFAISAGIFLLLVIENFGKFEELKIENCYVQLVSTPGQTLGQPASNAN